MSDTANYELPDDRKHVVLLYRSKGFATVIGNFDSERFGYLGPQLDTFLAQNGFVLIESEDEGIGSYEVSSNGIATIENDSRFEIIDVESTPSSPSELDESARPLTPTRRNETRPAVYWQASFRGEDGIVFMVTDYGETIPGMRVSVDSFLEENEFTLHEVYPFFYKVQNVPAALELLGLDSRFHQHFPSAEIMEIFEDVMTKKSVIS